MTALRDEENKPEIDRHEVCVAGFWGFRHATSTNPSRLPTRLEADVLVSRRKPTAKPPATLARTTQEELLQWIDSHLDTLCKMVDAKTPGATDAEEVFERSRTNRSVLLYFLTHVELGNDAIAGLPYIAMTSMRCGTIDGTTLTNLEVDLAPARPVVFINACNSAAATSTTMVNLVQSFMDHGASGAIGTQMRVFSDFAMFFGAEVVLALVGQPDHPRLPLGEALRRTRVKALRCGTPMGLVYGAYGLHNLRFVDEEEAQASGA